MENFHALSAARKTDLAAIHQIAHIRWTSARAVVDVVGVLDAERSIVVLVESCEGF